MAQLVPLPPVHYQRTIWPTMIPPDFRRRLDEALSFRNVEAADIWTEVRDWLIKHQVQPPERLPEEERR